jgi:acyl carrier protein
MLRDLHAAVEAGQISVRTPVVDALQQIYGLDSLDKIEMDMDIEEQPEEISRYFATVWDFLCVLDRMDRKDEGKHMK